MTMHPSRVAIVSEGWRGLADAASYYPPDLPEDWQLSYFANDYAGVYLPRQLWQAESASVLRGWRADVHDAFGFFLEAPPAADAAAASARAADALGAMLVACVRWHEAGADAGELWPACGAQSAAAPIGQALRCPPPLYADLRVGARWLRERACEAPATLVLLPQPTSVGLAQWRQLPALLGLAPLTPAAAD
jgi:hypothetical protein